MADSYIQRSPYPSPSYPSTDLYTFLQSYIAAYAARDALIDPSNGVSRTYKQIENEVDRVALGMSQHGVKQGDTVLCFAENSLEHIIMILATWKLGAVFCAVNQLLPVNDAQKLFAMVEPAYVFTDERHISSCLEIIKDFHAVKTVFIRETHPNCISYTSLKNSVASHHHNPQARNVRSDDVSCIVFSSGTTGLPKGVKLSHENLVSSLLALTEPKITTFGIQGIVFSSMAHMTGFMKVIMSIVAGSTIILMEKFDLIKLLENVSRYKVRMFSILTSVAVLLTKHPAVSNYDLSHVREIICAGAPLGADTIAELQHRLGARIHFRQGFGLTEATGICTLSPGRASMRKLHPHSIGFPVPGVEVKVVDIKTGKSLGPNEQGEIMCRGPNIMKGYLKNPKATAEAIDADGWLHTGDAGYYKPDSSFYIVDRLTELIKYKDYQIAPAELEDLLLSHPLVGDCAVIGVPDVDVGEIPTALVVRKEETLTEKDVVDFVSDKVEPFKRLRGGVRFVEQIPKTGSGKILRTRIKVNPGSLWSD